MKKGRMFWSAIILSVIFFVCCAPSTKTSVTRPAEINLVGIKRIAMGNIDGDTGSALSDRLVQKLSESGRYEVVDRKKSDALMKEHSLNITGAVDEQTAAKIGGLLGADALIFGSSNGQYRQKIEISDTKCGYELCKEYSKIGDGRINTTLNVVDLKTGKTLANKTFSDTGSDSNKQLREPPPDLDRNAIMGDILAKTVDKFMKMTAP